LTPPVDQQVGGLLMWVPGGLVYLGAAVAMLARWYGMPEDEPGGFPDERRRLDVA
jgi:cytochrome c oxidase assembly factor CtaG